MYVQCVFIFVFPLWLLDAIGSYMFIINPHETSYSCYYPSLQETINKGQQKEVIPSASALPVPPPHLSDFSWRVRLHGATNVEKTNWWHRSSEMVVKCGEISTQHFLTFSDLTPSIKDQRSLMCGAICHHENGVEHRWTFTHRLVAPPLWTDACVKWSWSTFWKGIRPFHGTWKLRMRLPIVRCIYMIYHLVI